MSTPKGSGGGVSKPGGSDGGVSIPGGGGGGLSISSKEGNSPTNWWILFFSEPSSPSFSIGILTSSSPLPSSKPGGGGGGGRGGIPGGGGGVSDMADAPSGVGLDVHWIGLTIACPQSYGLIPNTNG